MTKLECLEQATKALNRLEKSLKTALDRVRAKRAGPIDAAREQVEMWMRKAESKEPPADVINAPPEYLTAEEIAAGARRK